MKIDLKPFQLENELSSIDEMLANCSANTDFRPIVPYYLRDGVMLSNKAAVICVKVIFNHSNLSSETVAQRKRIVKAYRIIDKVIYDVFRDNDSCADVLHVGHYYIGIFYAPQTIDIDNVLDTMGKLNAALSVLDTKFKKSLSMSLSGVMAADFGEIMHSMDLAPYESWQSTPINNVIALCDDVYSKGNDYDGVTLITDSIKINLKEEYTKFFDTELSSTDSLIKSYKGYVVNTVMYNWVKQNQVYDTKADMEGRNQDFNN